MTSPALIASHLESSLKEHRPWVIALWDELILDELAELGRQMPRIPLGIDLAIDETCAVLYEGKGEPN
jgi:hypothetical protein